MANMKTIAQLELTNRSAHTILFKVKSTNIQNYLVRPNSDLVPSNCATLIKIHCQQSILAAQPYNDKFLVQIALVDLNKPRSAQLPLSLIKKVRVCEDPEEETEPLSVEELTQLWNWIDAAKELTQIKMKINFDLTHVQELVSQLEGTVDTQQVKDLVVNLSAIPEEDNEETTIVQETSILNQEEVDEEEEKMEDSIDFKEGGFRKRQYKPILEMQFGKEKEVFESAKKEAAQDSKPLENIDEEFDLDFVEEKPNISQNSLEQKIDE